MTGPLTGPRGRRLQAVMFAVLGLAAVILAVAATLLALRVHAAERAEARRHAVLHAARQEATDLTSLSYTTLDADIDRVLDGATGRFAAQFAGHTKELRALLPKVEAVTEGKVLSAGVVEASDHSARVLLAVDQTVMNGTSRPAGPPASTGGVVRHYRMAMTLTRADGRWLVSELRFVS